MDRERDDYADDGRAAEPATPGELARAFVLAFAAVLGLLFALMAFVAWSGFW
jgi:hypothetical protein